jgi:phosphoribosylformylglycinamidine synthase subunit PurL
MGAAGLTSSSCEMAARAGTGIEIDLSLVPQRETGMTAYEMLLSESQERMLIVAHAGREREVVDIFRKWDLDAVVIGRVREGNSMRVAHNGEIVADIPVAALTDEAPRYTRPMKRKDEGGGMKDEGMSESSRDPLVDAICAKLTESDGDTSVLAELGGRTLDGSLWAFPGDREPELLINHNTSLTRLLASPNLTSKQWVYRQYDHMVRTNTAVLPGADAAVVRIKETRRALAMSLDGNGRYCAADPRAGAMLVVAEAARNVVCVGARPLAITNCLNFASPERPEVMWSFSEVIDGMAEACRAFNTPVVSGNVSFYNETEGSGILPTPVIGMVGLIDDVHRLIQQGFKKEGDLIALLGETHDDLSISEYAATVLGQSTAVMIATGSVPRIDLKREVAVQAVCLEAAEAGLLNSAHDCSDGGLAIALAESCFSSLNTAAIGAQVELNESLSLASVLFSESPSRIIISFDEQSRGAIEGLAARNDCPFAILGRVTGNELVITVNGVSAIKAPITDLETAWRTSLGNKLRAEAMVAAGD